MSPPDPRRRALFGGAAAVLGRGLPSGAEAAPDADAALIAACDRYVRAELEWRRLLDAGDDEESEAAAAFNKRERDPAMNAVVALPPASTMAGLRAKAAAIVAFYDPMFDEGCIFDATLWEIVTGLAGPDVTEAFRRQRATLGVE